MAGTVLLADEVLPEHPLRQWAHSLPHVRWFPAGETDSEALTPAFTAASAPQMPSSGIIAVPAHISFS